MMNRDKLVGIAKTGLWFITTFWFAYLSANVLWNINKSSWMILLRFNEYGEAFIEIPIFLISTVWIVFAGTKRVSKNIEEHKIGRYVGNHISYFFKKLPLVFKQNPSKE